MTKLEVSITQGAVLSVSGDSGQDRAHTRVVSGVYGKTAANKERSLLPDLLPNSGARRGGLRLCGEILAVARSTFT